MSSSSAARSMRSFFGLKFALFSGGQCALSVRKSFDELRHPTLRVAAGRLCACDLTLGVPGCPWPWIFSGSSIQAEDRVHPLRIRKGFWNTAWRGRRRSWNSSVRVIVEVSLPRREEMLAGGGFEELEDHIRGGRLAEPRFADDREVVCRDAARRTRCRRPGKVSLPFLAPQCQPLVRPSTRMIAFTSGGRALAGTCDSSSVTEMPLLVGGFDAGRGEGGLADRRFV